MPEQKKFKKNDAVKEFAKISFKKYRKRCAFDVSKKEALKDYHMILIDLLPDAVEYVVRYGHINDPDVQETKKEIYVKISDPAFVKRLTKTMKKDDDITESLELLPIIIKDMLASIKEENMALLAENPNAHCYDTTDLVELAVVSMRKKLKKMEKKGIARTTAFDLLCIIPAIRAVQISRFFRIRAFYDCLYEHAKSEAVPFEDIMKVMIPKDFWEFFVTFALLERKERFSKLTDRQKELYITISTWCFTVLNEQSKDDIERILTAYVNTRKRDDAAGKDGPRRYTITAISESEFEKVAKVARAMVSHAPQLEKYLS